MTSYPHRAPSTKHQAPSTKHQYFTIFHRLTFAILCARKAASKLAKTRVSIKPAFSATYPLPESSAAVFGDVTSQNVVGYAQSQLNSGMKRILITPQFSVVGTTTKAIRLGDIKPVSTDSVGNAMVIIYTLTNTGKTDQTYTWTGTYWKHNNIDATEETLPEGKGLWVLCNKGAAVNVSLQSAGEVNMKDDIVFSLNGGMKRTAIGNGYPVEVKFRSIVPESVDGSAVGNAMVIIYTLTNTGKTDQTYTWTGSYWKHNNVDASEETLPAGKGIWVLCNIQETKTKVNLRIGNPFVK